MIESTKWQLAVTKEHNIACINIHNYRYMCICLHIHQYVCKLFYKCCTLGSRKNIDQPFHSKTKEVYSSVWLLPHCLQIQCSGLLGTSSQARISLHFHHIFPPWFTGHSLLMEDDSLTHPGASDSYYTFI